MLSMMVKDHRTQSRKTLHNDTAARSKESNMPLGQQVEGRATSSGLDSPVRTKVAISHHDTIKWFEGIPGEQLCIRVHGTQVNGRYAIMENIAAPGTATPMHFHAEGEIFHILEGTVTFSIDGDVFNASVGSIVVIPAGAHHAWRNRSNAPIRMSTFFSPGGVEELYPKLVGLSLEELPTVVEPFGSGIVGPPIDE